MNHGKVHGNVDLRNEPQGPSVQDVHGYRKQSRKFDGPRNSDSGAFEHARQHEHIGNWGTVPHGERQHDLHDDHEAVEGEQARQ